MKIYCLLDPITYEIRYVGITAKSLEERLRGHLKKTKRRSYKIHWINSLYQDPIIELLQEVHDDYWQVAEQYWISYFKSIGCKLTNSTIGGEGVLLTPEVKLKQAKAIKQAFDNDPTLALNTSKAMKARYKSMSDEERNAIAAKARTGCDSESFAKIHEQTRKNFKFIDPQGNTYIVKGMNKFCREHNLYSDRFYKVLKGEINNYKGWKCERL